MGGTETAEDTWRMFERFTDSSRRVVVLAQEESRLLGHDYIGTEHILLGLVHESDCVGAKALDSLGISLEAVRRQVEAVIGRGARPASGHIPFTARAKKVLELSLREALQLGHNYIGSEHILLGLIREREGVAAEVLMKLGVDFGRLRQQLEAHAGGRPPERLTTGSTGGYGSFVGLPMMTGRDACSFCGRDLWDVERHVASTSARICEECVKACQRAIGEAADQGVSGHEPLRLPPRVFGAQPPDDAAVSAVAEAFTVAIGGTGTEEERARHLEDGALLAPLLGRARARYPQSVGVVVQRVRFVAPARAQIRFAVLLDRTEIPLEGEAVQQDGHWRVSRATICQLLSMAGITPPPGPGA
jgi:hypothetical protein